MSALRTAASGLVLVAAASAASAMTAAEVYSTVSPSVWRVTTYDGDGLPLGQGSAVVIGPDALVTNCHVLAKARRVSVRHDKEQRDARLELWDVERDVCQLRAAGLGAPAVALAAVKDVVVGSPVYAIGNPRGLDLTVSAGLVSSLRRNTAGQVVLIQTSAAISGGSSGGGLFDDHAQLVGITTIGSVTGDAQNLNFAIPADWTRELPERHARRAQRGDAKPVATAPAATAPSDPAAASAAASPVAPVAPATNVASVSPATATAAPTSTERAADPARIDDLDKLPWSSPTMRERYREFLARPLPRAFVVSDTGSSRQASAAGDMPPAERALRDCRQAMTGNCYVYAIDDRVVWKPAPATAAR